MKEIFNDGLSEVIELSDGMKTYTNNVTRFDRAMKKKMITDRQKYQTLAVPITSRPVPTADLDLRLGQLKEQTLVKINEIKATYKATVDAAKRSKARRLRGGLAAELADREYKLAVAEAKSRAKADMTLAKSNARASSKTIQKDVLRTNMDYLREAKSELQRRIQMLERKVEDTTDLYRSGKMSKASSDGAIRSYKKNIVMLMQQMENLNKKGQVSTIDTFVKMGLMSKGTGDSLKAKKEAEFRTEAKRLGDSKLIPKTSFDPIDSETGRRISKQELARHIEFLKGSGGNQSEINRLMTIYSRMRLPYAQNVVEVQVHLIPDARKLNPKTGEGIYSTTESKRIQVHQHSIDIPSRAIAGEDQPNGKFYAPIKQAPSETLRALNVGVGSLHKEFQNLYQKAMSAGKGQDVRLQMNIGAIRDLHTEIGEAGQTNKNSEDVLEKLKQLQSRYENAISDLKKLVRY